MLETFSDRHYSPNGMLAILRLLVLQSHLSFPDMPADPVFRDIIHAVTAVSNQITIDVADQAAEYLAEGVGGDPKDPVLSMLREQHTAHDRHVRYDLAKTGILGDLPQWIDSRKFFRISAEGGNRTRTPLAGPRILSPVRLPVPPPRHDRLELSFLIEFPLWCHSRCTPGSMIFITLQKVRALEV